MKIVKLLFLITLLCLSGCYNRDRSFYNTKGLSESEFNISKHTEANTIKLYIPKQKLELFFGKDFIPVYNKFLNLDDDAEEEYLIAYKKNSSSPINIFIFDILRNDIIKKKFSFDTIIASEENFSIQVQNLMTQNDINLLIDGKSSDGKNVLYIIAYEKDNYKLIDTFTANFSAFIDYIEIETEKGKYNVLNSVITINNSFSSTNANIKKKDTYKWNDEKKEFYLYDSSEILSDQNIQIDPSIYSSEENYFNYIKGFWYPSEYKDLIDKDKLSPDDYSVDSSQFIYFSDSPKEVNIKYGDYIDRYLIIKISKLWQSKPGLRFLLKESTNPDNSYYKILDIYLTSPTVLKTSGPDRYTLGSYVRLQKPFIEYIIDKKKEDYSKKTEDMNKFLIGVYKNQKETEIDFQDKTFSVKNGKSLESGYYKINYNDNVYLLSFIFENKYNLLDRKNYLLNLSEDKSRLSLIPLEFNLNGYTIENIKPIEFKRINN
ncbi:MAG TPA: hypothetical protein PK385_04790 [Spirochaetota bacterium]|nr:hypothetical protein [Spirochaetota bacterium]HOS33086.1 hypothetical protein [Spirochaetota bacterium]HOS55356.1 hypothetical protein [Spirochaetota bacterium]HQF77867.1 hypothetical protein [Spirochaetota bacterium]HQH29962.1 hypothetical protein [Spirochaetota bacterium]